MFNEHLGYFGQDHFIAEIERNLDEQNLFAKFKEEIANHTGDTWEEVRDGIMFRTDEFAAVYSKIKNISYDQALKIIEKPADFSLSIEDFANRILKYINTKPVGFRLIFCVDEIGQYIADNTRLMLNLQTLAETLKTKCQGKAFIIVTSQNDLNTVIKDIKASQANDFSRIQDRFSVKIPLTSADADEVIQKRLLTKTKEAADKLKSIYAKEKNNLKTTFRFTEDSRQYTQYRDEDMFVNTYPFVPYQFELFQSTLLGLSQHNLFQGKHQSVGERSMLGVFQSVAKSLSESEVGAFVNYSAIYDGIRSTLKGELIASISQAERNLADTPMAIALLKVLFLVKYVKEFKANLQNITVLMQNSYFNEITVLRNNIQAGLNILEDQTYIRRNGDIYEYLTNDEKDIENEIKSTEIDAGAVAKELEKILFDEIIGDAKVKYESNNQVYEFGKKLDDRVIGREKEFYVHFVTPLNPMEVSKEIVNRKSFGANELSIYLADSERLMEELRLYVQTEKYANLKSIAQAKQEIKNIINVKLQQNAERRAVLINQFRECLKVSNMFLNGTEITDINSKEPATMVKTAVQKLIDSVYPNLKMLPGDLREDNIRLILAWQDDALINTPPTTAALEMLNSLTRKINNNESITVRSCIEIFSKKPYGWGEAPVLCIIAQLFKKSKIVIRKFSNIQTAKDLSAILTNRNEQANLKIELEESISTAEVKKLKDWHNDFFHEGNSGRDAKEVHQKFGERIAKKKEALKDILNHRNKFSFVAELDELMKLVDELQNREFPFYYKNYSKYADRTLDLKEEKLDHIKSFLLSPQKDLYIQIRNYYEQNLGNISFMMPESQAKIQAFMQNQVPYRNNFMVSAKSNYEAVRAELTQLIDTEQEAAVSCIKAKKIALYEMPEAATLTDEQRSRIDRQFDARISAMRGESFIGNIKTAIEQFERQEYPTLMQEIHSMATANQKPPQAEQTQSVAAKLSEQPAKYTATSAILPKVPAMEYISIKTIEAKIGKSTLNSEDDVQEYIDKLQATLNQLIRDNKRITL